MNKLYSFGLTLCLLFGMTIIVAAQTEQTTPGVHTPVVKARQKRQSTRIKRGVRSKELTKRETGSLMKNEKEIREEKREARADGTVTGAERKEIQKDQNQVSRKIYRKKHNDRTRK